MEKTESIQSVYTSNETKTNANSTLLNNTVSIREPVQVSELQPRQKDTYVMVWFIFYVFLNDWEEAGHLKNIKSHKGCTDTSQLYPVTFML